MRNPVKSVFTFQYGATKTFLEDVLKATKHKFTFQYGATKTIR